MIWGALIAAFVWLVIQAYVHLDRIEKRLADLERKDKP